MVLIRASFGVITSRLEGKCVTVCGWKSEWDETVSENAENAENPFPNPFPAERVSNCDKLLKLGLDEF